YGGGNGGILTIHRGNVDFLFPNSPDAQLHRARGELIDAPFFPEARAIDIPVSPDFIGAGDFDNDGHRDVIVAARGSHSLYLLSGDGHGNFKPSQAIPLPGAITALTAGEINLADGLVDIVVGVVPEDGPKVL